MSATTPLAFSISDAARQSATSRTVLYAEARAGRIRFKKIGRRSVIEATELARWLASLPSKTA